MCVPRFRSALFLSCWLLASNFAHAAAPRVLPDGKLPNDARLQPLKDLDGYFPFEPPASAQQWQLRAAEVRRRVLVADGLWPMPTKTPLNAVIHGRIERQDYTVEQVYFESLPGFFVTGNLYRPQGAKGKHPGVLCPHGHWANGRFYDAGEARARKDIEQGAEKFVEAARSPLQARCVHLARMGCVVFHYDMIGYADSTQISFELAHRFAKQRPDMNAEKNWGLFSPQAESHLQSVMGMQTYNSIRAVDFLLTLPDVDPNRLAVTGASGGGTQSMILAAIEPRLAVSMPAVMVSTAMQGGCTCENCSLLRIATGNVEFAALFAPQPQGLTAADDWTKEMESKGFPELQQLYKTLGAPGNVMLASHTQFKHNYNAVCRAAMYRWFNEHLALKADVEERDFKRLTQDEMSVWDDEHPRPAGGPDFERGLLRWWHEDAEKQLAAVAPEDEASLDRYRVMVGGALDIVLDGRLPDPADLNYERTIKKEIDDFLEIGGLISNSANGSELPVLFFYPKQWNGQVVIWLHPDGKDGLYEKDGRIRSEIRELVASGATIMGVDLFYQGEFLAKGQPLTETRRVANPRESAAYTFGYNNALFAQRVQDVLTVISYVRHHELEPEQIHLVGLDGAGPWAAAARAQAREVVDRAAIDTSGFRFGQVDDIHDPDFLPGGAKYNDLPGMLSLSAPHELWLAGEGANGPTVVVKAYKAAGAGRKLSIYDGAGDKKTDAAVQWLLQ